jgi:hypothetical protein
MNKERHRALRECFWAAGGLYLVTCYNCHQIQIQIDSVNVSLGTVGILCPLFWGQNKSISRENW